MDNNGGVTSVSTPMPPANPTAPAGGATLIAGKFKTQDEFIKAYKELETKLHQQPTTPATPPTTPAATTPATPPAPPAPDFDIEKYEQEFAANSGKLSDASYSEITKNHNVTKEQVDSFIAGRQAAATERANQIFNIVGGKEKYEAMTAWAHANLSQQEKGAFNKAVNGQDQALAQMTVQGLHAKYAAANPTEPQLLGGRSTPGNIGYESRQQMIVDMQNPLYYSDPAFRDKVIARIAVSKFS